MTWRDELAQEHSLLLEIIEEALEPYKATFPLDAMEHFREELLVLMATHPYPQALLDALRKRPAVSASTDVDKYAAALPPAAPKRERRG